MRAPGRPRRSGIGIRLVALVLVPLLALAGLAARIVDSARDAAADARGLEADVDDIRRLATLVDAIQAEQAGAQVVLLSGVLGGTPEDAFALLGDAFRTDRVRPATDAALRAAARTVPEVGAEARALAQLRDGLDARTLHAAGTDQGYGAVEDRVHGILTSRATELHSAAADIAGGGEVARAVTAVVALVEAIHARADQFNNVAPLAIGSAEEQLRARAALGRAAAAYQRALDTLAASAGTSLVARWSALQRGEGNLIVDRALGIVAVGAPSTGRFSVGDLVALGRIGGQVQTHAHALADDAGALAAGAARDLLDDAESRYRRTLVLTIGAAALSLLLAAAVARSIARPLRQLHTRAARIGEGDLDVRPLRPRGPRAIRVVAEAFNDLVAVLRLLEGKSQALATCDFDNEVLAAPLPGRLGQSMEASISMLSGSIEERDQLQRRLAHQATHDALTGMQNRPAAIVAIEKALARGRRAGEPVSVLFVDLDGFKVVNDTFGHDVGDEVLRVVAARMTAVVREGDVVARLGGDEFLVVAERTGDAEATALAHRIVDALGAPIEAGARDVTVGASVGIALSVDGAGEALDILARADLALYRAKARGRACVELYDESLQAELLRRNDVERALAATLRRGGDELELHYQPVVDARYGDLRAVEALIRWERPGQGRVFPDEFIPVAEASDLIVDLDVWVLRTATRQALAWGEDGRLGPTAVSVNVSGRHLLGQRLHEHVRDVLAETGLPPERLILEVTETVLLTDIPTAASELAAIRELGVRVAVDDFGTGYTSLAALQGLPIDSIKVDRSFTAGLEESRQRSLVAMVAQLGHQLGVTVVAEGVETAEQLSALQELGCDEIQGYFICRPVPEPELRAAFGATAP